MITLALMLPSEISMSLRSLHTYVCILSQYFVAYNSEACKIAQKPKISLILGYFYYARCLQSCIYA